QDPLRWWTNNKAHLHHMALDYLSVPGEPLYYDHSLVCFRKAGSPVHFTHNRFSPRSVQAFLCLGSWVRHNMIPSDVLAAVVQSKKAKVFI
ncbi:hypothetical protein PAXRUDRAFT_152568, partial [Paxillus rubicundulus Ve08.2h10]